MDTQASAAHRRGWVGIALAVLAAAGTPSAFAACNPNAHFVTANLTVPETTNGAPTIVQLDGSNSGPNNKITFAWSYLGSIPAGLPVSLSSTTAQKPTFAAPAVGANGATLRFQLTVTCTENGAADTNTTNVNVTDVVVNQPPTASALVTPSGNVGEGQLVTLDGSGSFDPDPGTTLAYQWSQVGGSPAVTLSPGNASGSIVTFVAPDTPVTTGATLTFRLLVSDGTLSNTTDKIVNVLWSNDPPVARLACPAGGVVDVDEGASVVLDGSASSDSDGTIASYAWQQGMGLPVLGVSGLTTPSIQFTAPQLGYNQLGGTSVTLTVTDNTGAQSTASCSVFIHDVTAPALALPADITAEATSSSGAAVGYTALAQDAVDDASAYPASCTPASGSTFGLAAPPTKARTTAVSCSAQDSAGNRASGGFNVTVQDTTAPVISAPGGLGLEATSAAGAVGTFSATTRDAVDGEGNATCAPASGSTFGFGATTVTCTASDARNNAATPASFVVNVLDTTAPTIDQPDDVGPVEATGASGAGVTFASPATHDAVDGDGTATCTPPSGSTFALGTSAVHCDATDAHGNHAEQASFNVTVVDTTPPNIATHADVGPQEATSAGGAYVSYLAPATSDLVDGAGSATCLPASGGQFALGDTTVTCNASDAHHNPAAPTTFTVKVRDTTAPVIAAHADVGPTEATGPLGAIVTYGAPTTADAVDGDGLASCAPASGSQFALGSTTVSCSAVDVHGNVSTPTTFQVTVQDTTPPVIAFHADVTATATGNSSALVSYTPPTASDLVDGSTAVSCLPASGGSFPVGTTTVTCSTQDSRGNPASSSFKVIVSYPFSGFFRPVDNLPVVNVAKAGSAIPVKFSLGGDQGLAIFAKASPASAAMTCSSGSVQDAVEETLTAGGSSLSYDPTTGQYTYVWKSDKAWAGSCRQLQVKFADGSARVANFSFTR